MGRKGEKTDRNQISIYYRGIHMERLRETRRVLERTAGALGEIQT
jgi:hypothetical protein